MQNFFSWEKDDDNKVSMYMPKSRIKSLGPQSIGLMKQTVSGSSQPPPKPSIQNIGPTAPTVQPPQSGGISSGSNNEKDKTQSSPDYEMKSPDFTSVPNYTGADPWDPKHYEGMFVDPNNPIYGQIGNGLGELINPVFDPGNYEGLLTGGLSGSNPVFDPGAYEGTFINPDDPLGLSSSFDGGILDTLGGAWQKVKDYVPLIGLGASIYDMVKGGEITPMNTMALGTSALGSLTSLLSGASLGAWGLLPAAPLMIGSAFKNDPSREYFDPTSGMDLGDGKYLMLGSQVESDDKVGYDDLTQGDNFWQNTTGSGSAWDLIYDSNTNNFMRLNENSLFDPISKGALNPDEYAKEAYDQQQTEMLAMDGFGGVDNSKTYEELLNQFTNSQIYQPDQLTEMAGMGGYSPKDWETAASPQDLYNRGLMTEDTIRQKALDAIENEQYQTLEYGMFKDAPAVANYNKKYPMMLSSLQTAYQQMANQYGWGGTDNV